MRIVKDARTVSGLPMWRAVESIVPSKEAFEKALTSGRRLKIYFGIDATGPDLHLGHAVGLRFLRDIQKLGHEAIVLIGDFTARIGDPTGRDAARRPLGEKEIGRNIRTYRRQIAHFLSFAPKPNPVRLVRNSQWLSRLRLSDVIRLASSVTIQQLLERDMFQRRLRERRPIGLHEFLYPLLQGYDSVALGVDAEVGGSDQLFNMMVGRKLLEAEAGKSKFVIALKLVENPETGEKMSKSAGTYVPLTAPANDLFGRIMAIPDAMVWTLFELVTDVPQEEIGLLRAGATEGRGMRSAKVRLAGEIVSFIHGPHAATRAAVAFERIFVEKRPPLEIETMTIPAGTAVSLPALLVKTRAARSNSDAVRLIRGGGVSIDGVRVGDWRKPVTFTNDAVIRIGKKKFLKIRVT